jgi:hypothetical protein
MFELNIHKPIAKSHAQRTVQQCEMPGYPEEVFAAFSVDSNCLMLLGYDLLTATYRMSVSCLPPAPDRSSNADTIRSS